MKVETLCCQSHVLTSHFEEAWLAKRREGDIRVYVIVLTAWTGLSRGANKRADDWKMSSGAGAALTCRSSAQEQAAPAVLHVLPESNDDA